MDSVDYDDITLTVAASVSYYGRSNTGIIAVITTSDDDCSLVDAAAVDDADINAYGITAEIAADDDDSSLLDTSLMIAAFEIVITAAADYISICSYG
ncbi:hypothetical protein DPMN_174475 [Dreissena polymorpha]|uniref:Uncharacterized protein n=1 Tax=Dreissena polymorpha TaxID=45954 RepID=A0A9D4IF60_DREPO|nr:hypothetical protein DPMN_174475 [Dreissena polymorpha]